MKQRPGTPGVQKKMGRGLLAATWLRGHFNTVVLGHAGKTWLGQFHPFLTFRWSFGHNCISHKIVGHALHLFGHSLYLRRAPSNDIVILAPIDAIGLHQHAIPCFPPGHLLDARSQWSEELNKMNCRSDRIFLSQLLKNICYFGLLLSIKPRSWTFRGIIEQSAMYRPTWSQSNKNLYLNPSLIEVAYSKPINAPRSKTKHKDHPTLPHHLPLS